jgi:protoheme IX farnesyltransferase
MTFSVPPIDARPSDEPDSERSLSTMKQGTTLVDLVALTKPRLSIVVLSTTLGGFFMGVPRTAAVSGAKLAAVVVGTALVVGGANALNMYLERDSDRFMQRTANRPLPAGRMAPGVALAFGLALTFVALLVLAIGAGPIAALLAAIANTSYVLLYTPMKARSWWAVWAGAVPGAIPPLLGWAAATGQVDLAGLSLFGLMFFWQIPHFHAIALFRSDEYARAGLKVLPLEQGERVTRRHIAFWGCVLLAATLAPWALGLSGFGYLVAALGLGIPFAVLGLAGLRAEVPASWPRRYFGLSIPYLIGLFAALLASRP